MSVYLQFESSARSNVYIIRNDLGVNTVNSVAAATTADLSTLNFGAVTYTNGAQTLTPANTGQLEIDSVFLTINLRVLVKNQTDARENGVYVVTDPGSPTTTWILTRAADWNQAVVPITDGTLVQIGTAGSLNGGTCWAANAGGAIAQVDPLAGATAVPFIEQCLWFPNDPRYSLGQPIQSPSNYRTFYRELNDCNNIRTIGFLAHCKERPENLNFSVEFCVLTVPANALIARDDGAGGVAYTSVLNEPYLYVRMMPIEHAEGKLIYGNNSPPLDAATFIVWCDKTQLGPDAATFPTVAPAATVDDPPLPENINEYDALTGQMEALPATALDRARWVIYKSCMITVMRLNLCDQEWQIRIYDRYGNDIVLYENDNAGAGFLSATEPSFDPSVQTQLLVGIKPNYPL